MQDDITSHYTDTHCSCHPYLMTVSLQNYSNNELLMINQK